MKRDFPNLLGRRKMGYSTMSVSSFSMNLVLSMYRALDVISFLKLLTP